MPGTPDICPNCGEELPTKVKACPQCGADEKTSWSEAARYDSLNLPDVKFNYNEFVEEEFGKPGLKPRGLHWFWWLVALLLLVGVVLVCIR